MSKVKKHNLDNELKTIIERVENDASTSQKGPVQLSSDVESDDETKAATSKAVKLAYEKAEQAFTQVSDGKDLIATSITDKGGTASGSDTFSQLANAISLLGGGGIKSIQRGEVAMRSTTVTVEISPIVPNNSIVLIDFSPNTYYGCQPVPLALTATSFKLEAIRATNNYTKVYYTVIEFEKLAKKLLTYHDISAYTGDPKENISVKGISQSFDPSKSLVIGYYKFLSTTLGGAGKHFPESLTVRDKDLTIKYWVDADVELYCQIIQFE